MLGGLVAHHGLDLHGRAIELQPELVEHRELQGEALPEPSRESTQETGKSMQKQSKASHNKQKKALNRQENGEMLGSSISMDSRKSWNSSCHPGPSSTVLLEQSAMAGANETAELHHIFRPPIALRAHLWTVRTTTLDLRTLEAYTNRCQMGYM